MSDPYVCEINLLSAMDWQRSAADTVKRLIDNDQHWMQLNHCDFWTDWQKNVFNLSTANDFGLSVWAIILDEPIYAYSNASPSDYPNFGFSNDAENFFNGSFAVDNAYSYELTTERKRIILKLKAFKVLAMGGPIHQINKAMNNIFGKNVILAFDRLDMSFVYQLSDKSVVDFIRDIRDRDLLPRPIGIDASEVRTEEPDTLGFASGDENFYDGNFFNGNI